MFVFRVACPSAEGGRGGVTRRCDNNAHDAVVLPPVTMREEIKRKEIEVKEIKKGCKGQKDGKRKETE